MEIKISVIMPVYNMDRYIKDAIESFISQTLKEKEIIIIDDGSTDNSYNIAKSYAEIYCSIMIIQQDNKGSGEARNFGVAKAKGEYVCFLDADDFYASDDVLEYLYELAKCKKALICGGSSCDYINGIMKREGIRKERTFIENQYVKKEDYPGIAGYWAFIFKREFLLKNNIFFPNYLRGQDAPFFAKAIAYAKRVYCSNKLVYIYRKQHKEIQFEEKNAVDLVKSYRDILAIAIKYNMKNIQQVVFEDFRGEIGALIYKFSYTGSAEMTRVIKEINVLSSNSQLLYDEYEINDYIEAVKKEKVYFIKKLKETDRVYVFGAGLIGTKMVQFLKNSNTKIEGIIVSDLKRNCSMIADIPVETINQINIDDSDYLVIIATYWYSQKEIILELEKKGVVNIYPINMCSFFLWQDEIIY